MTQLDLLPATRPAGDPEPAGLADWLRQHLVATGRMTETGATRRAQVRNCRRCGATVLVGLDRDRGALEVEADPWPLSPLGEVVALVEGRRTVTLNAEGGRRVLNDRYDLQIEGAPAGTKPNEDVLREHRCRTPRPALELTTTSMHPSARQPTLPAGSPAPF